jgi:hypothetical protein
MTMRHLTSKTRVAFALVGIHLALMLGACRLIPGSQYVGHLANETFNKGRISKEELREATLQYASRFESTIIATSDTIAQAIDDPVIQRRALRWKLLMTPVITDAAFQREPESAYVALLTLATSLYEYLTTGSGTEVFGEQQPTAIAATAELVVAAKELGTRFLDAKELARVTSEVEALVKAQPIRGEFVAEKVQSLVTASTMSPIFDWVTAIPMSPFKALQGVDEGAQAIREFNQTAMEMVRTVNVMPRLIRWNMQLLALDVTQQGEIETTLENFDALARSAESLSQTAESLPGMLRALLAEAEHTGRSLEPLSRSLERTATAVAEAGQAWGGLFAELSKPPADPTRPSRPFDIREWEATAARVTSAATELRALLDSVDSLAGSDSMAGPLAELTARVEQVEAGSRALVDLVAWRVLQLILTFFGLLFVYRLVSHALEARGRRT